MMDAIINGFIEEVNELLVHMEDDLIRLEKDPHNTEMINQVFRVMHTLKGSAGMVGYKNIQDLTHEFESVYERIREGTLPVDSEIIDLTLKAKDRIGSMLHNSEQQGQELIEMLKGKMETGQTVMKSKNGTEPTGAQVAGNFYMILFSPDSGIFERGLDPDNVLNELKASGEALIFLHEKKKEWKKQKEEKICHTEWELYLKTPLILTEVEDVFLFYKKEEFKIFKITPGLEQIDPFLSGELTRIYKNRIKPEQQLKDSICQLSHLSSGETSGVDEKTEVFEKIRQPEISKTEKQSTVNVISHKLDELMNMVSELVTLTGTMEIQTSYFNDQNLNNSMERIEKLTKKFRNIALDLRLVPVGTLLARFKRQVRDLSRDLGKDINLIIEGQDIEIDKTILRSIESPLQHIIRNSIDHGLESGDERIAKGKPPEGFIKITAFYSGANVIIQVQDDGRGIDLDKVRESAIKKRYIQHDQVVTQQELINLIMEPGFTTRENISMVSGRGVGMDVVRKELNSVGGSLEVFTEKELGTSITIKLPTTLTIIDTLMVDVADTQILIPIMDIEYCFREKSENLFNKDNRYIEYKDYPVPLISLREQFKYPAYEKNDMMVILINKFDRKYALVVDQIAGEHQAVIKPLGELFITQPFFSGGSIMVDGTLAFILDTNFIFNHVNKM